ncbi:ADP-ribosylglycohydrolase family protein [Jannaschia seohaensis]|uniref:ADP-ribosylglycohydrolase family protein n=1 Tax=Jannaschia seohaensis TaxID=475081 RepID=UPI000D6BBFD6|nr:ADP-ribosylglycohydrolase family protein [Jannaschia seohaensis]
MFTSDKIRACFLGGAIGDALGAEVEFWSLDRIRREFPDGLTELIEHDGIRGAITDDTQMSLFTAEGLIRAVVRKACKGICHPPGVIHHALLRCDLPRDFSSTID